MEDQDSNESAAVAAAQSKTSESAPEDLDPGQTSNGIAGPSGADSSADRLSASATATSS